MYFPKNFYLKKAIDKKINELSTAGLLQYWTQKYADKRFLSVKNDVKGPMRLSTHHLVGIINIWLLGCAVSFVIFLFEILSAMIRNALRMNKQVDVEFSPEITFEMQSKDQVNEILISDAIPSTLNESNSEHYSSVL